MKHLHATPKRRLLTSALMLALAHPAIAQVATEDPEPPADAATREDDAEALDTVTVTGIRASLESSMNLKRDAQGVVDGIVAEDIGKFPDTNLAESLQRISGVSIDRSLGEGSRVTVRGIGPDFNLVLLNGRQMPASSNGGGAGPSNSRAFDFANLASEAVSQVDVYKTSRASTPTGGIGAAINIRTARPLEAGPQASIGFKAVHDTTVDNLPDNYRGDSFTPEVSGIFSQTFADGRFGIALTGSYQERDLGFSQVAVPNGWRGYRGDNPGWGTIPQPGAPGSENIVNRPGPNDIYSLPQNLNYSVNGVQRQRTNGQLTLQYAPTDRVTATLDYTYSENKVQLQRNELSVWFNYGPSASSWTSGPVAGPIYYSEIIDPAQADLSMGGMELANKNENDSLGFNVEWQVTDRLSLDFDIHDSTADTRPDSRYGSAGVLGVAAMVRGTTTVDFSGDFPILTVDLPPGMTQVEPSQAVVTGSVFQNARTRSEIEQAQVRGTFEFGDYSGLDFGLGSTEVNNRTAYGFMQRDTWGGVGSPDDYPDDIWFADSMSNYFGSFAGHNDPRFSSRFLVFDFERLRQRAAEVAGNESWYLPPEQLNTDLRTREKSRSAYLQWNTSFDWRIPVNVSAGVRYEETEVSSSALVPIATGIEWGSANELNVQFSDPGFTTLTGKYEYWLPNLDFGFELTEDMVLRASYGETIGRPGWIDIQGGQTLDQIVRVDGGMGNQGNPNLKPLHSKNFDVSWEWYYGESSYLSIGYFRKNIDNYIGTTRTPQTPFELNTPIGGAYWNEAIANGCPTADLVCIRNYILTNYDGQPGVVNTGVDSNGNQTGTIAGRPGDPIATFNIAAPANTGSSSLDGWEFNVQHVFGESGFGLAANYTIVDSPDLSYDNANLEGQFALVGLSDSANLVAFYEKGPWQARVAYNWRDTFLSGVFDGTGNPNPNYVEAFGQIDANVSYEWNDRLTLFLEGINITDETMRIHGRHRNQLLFGTQTGPRYMVGFRFKM